MMYRYDRGLEGSKVTSRLVKPIDTHFKALMKKADEERRMPSYILSDLYDVLQRALSVRVKKSCRQQFHQSPDTRST